MNNNIEAIIFDLGGVIINIDFEITQKEFAKLRMENPEKYFGIYNQTGFFDKLDKGEIGEKEFFKEISNLLPETISNNAIEKAWNAMILDFPRRRIEMLKDLRKNYKIFLLTNTNIIHYYYYSEKLKDIYQCSLESLFDKVYLSFKMGMRKPDPEIFLTILQENSLAPNKTMFVDDTLIHIKQAEALGIYSYLMQKDEDVTKLFVNGKLIY